MKAKKYLQIIQCSYGTAFVLDDKIVHYIHENDGNYRDEYFNPLIKALGFDPVRVKRKNLSPSVMTEIDEDEL